VYNNPVFCPRCGRQNDDTANYCQGCGSSLHAAPITSSTVPATGIVEYATFGQRLVAILIDLAILTAATGSVAVATFGVGVTLGFLAPWLYEAFMTSSEWQATVGKRVMSIIVTDLQGKRISFTRATGRHFAKYVSALLLGIGFIIAAFTTKRQALHDMIAETLVIKRQKNGNLP
jgi:uncharacterized RDD family membrane protein YckC